MTPQDFEGTWSLESYRVDYDDGRVAYPFGDDVTGVISYQQGRVSVIFGSCDRPRFAHDSPQFSTDAERSAAGQGFFAYSGTYDVVDNVVVHHIDICLFPNWVGDDQFRTARFDGDLLRLEFRAGEETSRASTLRLVWKRMAPHQPLS